MKTVTTTDHPEVRAVEDMAWDIKDCAADLYGRSLSEPDKAALGSALRDLERIKTRLVAVRSRRRRGNGAAEPELPGVDP
jgi:hypothetical protein